MGGKSIFLPLTGLTVREMKSLVVGVAREEGLTGVRFILTNPFVLSRQRSRGWIIAIGVPPGHVSPSDTPRPPLQCEHRRSVDIPATFPHSPSLTGDSAGQNSVEEYLMTES